MPYASRGRRNASLNLRPDKVTTILRLQADWCGNGLAFLTQNKFVKDA